MTDPEGLIEGLRMHSDAMNDILLELDSEFAQVRYVMCVPFVVFNVLLAASNANV